MLALRFSSLSIRFLRSLLFLPCQTLVATKSFLPFSSMNRTPQASCANKKLVNFQEKMNDRNLRETCWLFPHSMLCINLNCIRVHRDTHHLFWDGGHASGQFVPCRLDRAAIKRFQKSRANPQISTSVQCSSRVSALQSTQLLL